ncbi:hypothetical protein VPH35_069207 [Triticum aestivum]
MPLTFLRGTCCRPLRVCLRICRSQAGLYCHAMVGDISSRTSWARMKKNMTMSFPTRSRRFCQLNELTMWTASSSTSAREICSCHDEVVQPAKRRRSSSSAGSVAPKPSRDTRRRTYKVVGGGYL